jgi:hypothetical protein
MGGVSCCERSDKNQQLILIEQIIAEDRYRTSMEAKSIFSPRYNSNFISRIQKFARGVKARKIFFDKFNLEKKIFVEYMKSHLLRKDISFYIPNSVNQIEQRLDVEDFKLGKYYRDNISKWKNNRFLVNLPASNVDPLKNNDIYEGGWNIRGKFQGYGVLIKSDGSKYEGFWLNGVLHGIGRYISKEANFYEGSFKNGVTTGYGLFIHNDGTRYEGSWFRDQPHGLGKEYFLDGSYFEGTFNMGRKYGKCVYAWPDGSCYIGEISDDSFNGLGKYIWADGKVYDGSWLNGKFHGVGTLRYPHGAYYEGTFKNNQRNGTGRYQWNKNKYYDGTWQDGKQQGRGIYYKNGKLIKGIWNLGKLNYSKVMTNNLNYLEENNQLETSANGTNRECVSSTTSQVLNSNDARINSPQLNRNSHNKIK